MGVRENVSTRLWLLALVLICAGCRVAVPRPPGLALQVESKAKVKVDASVEVEARAEPPAPVELEGAEVVEFFGIPLDDAADVVFVLDRSGSMSQQAQGRIAQISAPPPAAPPDVPPDAPPDASQDAPPPPPPPAPRKIDVAHHELVDALERLPDGTRLNVVFFNSTLEAASPTLFTLEGASRDALIGFVMGTEPSGSTALAPAMRTAFLMNASRVVLLSDGLGNVGGGAAVVLRDAREAMRGGVRIDAIGLGANQDFRLLQTLAAESGGLYQGL